MGEIRARCNLSLQNSCACVMVIEAVAVAHSLVFCLVTLCHGRARFDSNHDVFTSVVDFDYLIPLIVIQVLWICANLIALLAIKCTIPYLILPYLGLSIISLVIAVILLGLTIDQVITWSSFTWTGTIILIILSVFSVLELYFTGLKLSTFRALVKRKKAVQGTSSDKPAVASLDRFSSFSRRSTVVISDDFFEPPPRL